MSDLAVNRAIEALLTDSALYEDVVASDGAALRHYDLSEEEQEEIVTAVKRGATSGSDTFSALRTVARFGPLFAAASASSTKVG